MALAVAVAAVVSWASTRSARAVDGQEGSVDLELGAELYAFWCVQCHGSDGSGVVGEGAAAGPAVNDLDVAYHDLLLRTGRMPIVDPSAGIVSAPDFSARDRLSLVAWMAEAFDLPGEVPVVVGTGSAADGSDLYALHCAACHGGGGLGGVSGGGATVRAVRGLAPEAVVAAIRVGPFAMPRFSEAVISDEEAVDIAAFVTALSEDRPTLLGLRELHRVAIAVLAVPLLVAVVGGVFVAAHAGTKRGR